MGFTFIASTSQVLWRVLDSYGVDPAPLFRQAGLDPQRWEEPDARFDNAKLDAAWVAAVAATGDPCIGLRASRFVNPGSLHALGFAWLVSDNLYEALERLVRYFRMISDGMQLELSLSGDECRLAIDRILDRGPGLIPRLDAFWAALLALCRLSLSDAFAPKAVALQRPAPTCVADFYGLFRSAIEFAAPRDMMIFDRDQVERPLPTANRELARSSERVVAAYLDRFGAEGFPDMVRVRLIELLPSGAVDEAAVAQSLNVSRRTLQRRLAVEQTSYKAILDEARRELALRFIGEEGMSIKEATYVLGFSEPSNFSRAFKRWTGQVPSEYHKNAVSCG